jgi:hypothetical protein
MTEVDNKNAKTSHLGNKNIYFFTNVNNVRRG